MKKISIITFAFLLLGLTPQLVNAQDLSETALEEKPKSVLRMGLSSFDRFGHELGIELNYERFLTPRLGVRASLFHNLRLNKSSNIIARGFGQGGMVSFTDYNQVANFSVAFNYYFKPNSQSGHFLSLQIMDAFTFLDRTQYTFDATSSTINPLITAKDKRVFESNPLVGLYYGYRKDFNSGFFLEGKLGVYYDGSVNNLFRTLSNWVPDAHLTIGWTIPFTKKNKR